MSRLRHAGRILADVAITIAVYLRLVRWPEHDDRRTR